MGLAFGYALGPNSAPTMLNLVNLPMAFASGLYIPLSQLPPFVQHLAPYLPAYHFGQLALAAIGAHGVGTVSHHLVALPGSPSSSWWLRQSPTGATRASPTAEMLSPATSLATLGSPVFDAGWPGRAPRSGSARSERVGWSR